MKRAALLISCFTIGAIILGGCGRGDEEERTQDDVAAEFIERVEASEILFDISGDSAAPASLTRFEGPCSPYGEDRMVFEDVLTEDELYWVCCERFAYEASRVHYDDLDRAVRIEATPVECID